MIESYLKIAWRNLLRNKLYSVINIGGLAIGMAVSFLLLLYVYNEFTFNSSHKNIKRIYKVFRSQSRDGEIYTSESTPVPLASAIIKDYPEVEKVTRAKGMYDILVGHGDVNIKLSAMATDAAILDIFTFEFVKGSKGKALSDGSSIILTESGAKALFGNGDAVGKHIRFGDSKYSMKVSAVIKDNPPNADFSFKALIPWQAYSSQQRWVKEAGWDNYSFNTFILLKTGITIDHLNAKIKNIIQRYDPENKENTTFFYPLERLHLHNEFKNGVAVGGRIEYVRLFFFLAVGILLIACINFMNLSTARSEHRAREVGVRKTIGARKFSLIKQFLFESLLMAFLAFLGSMGLLWVLLPVFSSVIEIPLVIPKAPGTLLVGIGITALTGFLAGSYPAFFLSSFKPLSVLKGNVINRSSVKPRQILVVLQFTFAICLILSSLFVYKQIKYIKNRPLGYNSNGLLELQAEGEIASRFENFRRDAIGSGAIINGAISSGSITNNGSSSWGVIWPGQRPGEDKIPIDMMAVTHHFVSTYGLKLLQGRDFEMGRNADSAGVILNESAVQLMRLKNPLGTQIVWQDEKRVVIGVVKNFVWGSPYEPAKPAIIGFYKGWTEGIGLRLNPAKPVSQSLAMLATIYKKYNPQYPFEYKFTDESFDSKFKEENLLGTMATYFTALAIIISCLGLFGLASFSAEQRRKEIGIRKVLGANTIHLWAKLSQEFVKLVLISFAIGAAISWYNVDKWLSQYTYHTSISAWVFVATLVISIALCLLTVSWQAVRAALANPVKSLKSE